MVLDHIPKYIDAEGDMVRFEISSYLDLIVSDFLRKKLSSFSRIQQLSWHQGTWFADNVVIKRYTTQSIFDKAVGMQKTLFSRDPLLVCELLETWTGVNEWFTVSKDEGISPEEASLSEETDALCIGAKDKMTDVRIKLWSMNLFLFDDHEGNFVINNNGVCRVIDYESVEDAATLNY